MATITIETLPVIDAIADRQRTLGMSNRQLAMRLGTSPTTITNWMRGTVQPTIGGESGRMLQRNIARFLGVSPYEVADLFEIDLARDPFPEDVPTPYSPGATGGYRGQLAAA